MSAATALPCALHCARAVLSVLTRHPAEPSPISVQRLNDWTKIIKAGPCDADTTDAGGPYEATFSNIKFGDIGTTVGPVPRYADGLLDRCKRAVQHRRAWQLLRLLREQPGPQASESVALRFQEERAAQVEPGLGRLQQCGML